MEMSKKLLTLGFGIVFCVVSLGNSFSTYAKRSNEVVAHAHLGETETNELFGKLLSNESTNIFLKNNYSSYYFSNLRSNFGNNTNGTCAYVSIGMMLSFYDTYWDDSFIPEKYDAFTTFQSNKQPLANFDLIPSTTESPGIDFEPSNLVSNLTNEEYLTLADNYSNEYFQFKLISLGKQYLGNNHFDNNAELGLTNAEINQILSQYVHSYIGFPSIDVIVEQNLASVTPNIRNVVIDKINDGVPSLLVLKNPKNNKAHSVIAYDYDDVNDEIYVHPGWRNDNLNTVVTHCSLSDLGYTEIVSSTNLLINNLPSLGKNYISSEGNLYDASNFAFPREIELISGNYLDTEPMFCWTSLFDEKWFKEYNLFFNFSILNLDRVAIFEQTHIKNINYTLTRLEWDETLFDIPGNEYYVFITLNSDDSITLNDFWCCKIFTKPDICVERPYVKPNEYGFEDAYPSDTDTENNFTKHTIRGFSFETRRYRTGYIHNEYIVLSPKRRTFNYAFIEYKFSIPLTRIDVNLSHWRDYASEQLNSSNGRVEVQEFTEERWTTVLDLLSEETALPRDRNKQSTYKLYFSKPVTNIRFYASTSTTNLNDNNKGRICIGNMTFYPYKNYENVNDSSSSFRHNKLILINSNEYEAFQNVDDVDFYRYYASYTNYIQFNIKSDWESYNLAQIEVYKSDNLTTPIYTYDNKESLLIDGITNAPEIYTKQGDMLFFKVSKINKNPISNKIITPFYRAELLSANYADCDDYYFMEKGYILDHIYRYNGSNNIYLYFDSSTAKIHINGNCTYKEIFLNAISIWNGVGIKKFVEVTNKNDADIILYCDYNPDSNGGVGTYNSFYDENNVVHNGTLYINEYYHRNYTYAMTLKTCIHELGHALGIGHIDYAGINNIMFSHSGNYSGKLGKGDIAVYRFVWEVLYK